MKHQATAIAEFSTSTVLLAVILVAGEPQDALFGIVLVTNALIGIGQELRGPSGRWTGSPCSARRGSG